MTDAMTKYRVGGAMVYHDTTGVSTSSAAETNLFVATNDTAGSLTNTAVANGFIDLGEYTGGEGMLTWTETAGNAGTLKVYAGTLGATATGQEQIGASQTITASGGDAPIIISRLPQYLRATITRTAGNITVKFRLELTRKASI